MPRDPKEIAALLPRDVAKVLYGYMRTRPAMVNRVLKRIGATIDHLEKHGVVLAPPDFEAVMTAFAVEMMHEALLGEEMMRAALLRDREVSRDPSNDDA